MKKIKGVIILAVIGLVLVLCGRFETTDKREGKVVEQNGFVVTVKDEFGFEWNWNTDKRFEEGDKVIVFVNNKGTFKNTIDDTIVRVKKAK